MKATESQIERANKIAEKSPLSFERIIEMVIKQDEKKGWKPMTKKDIQKMDSRNRVEAGFEVNFDFAERMRENARKNLPSSMR